jgi:hypothetical protein
MKTRYKIPAALAVMALLSPPASHAGVASGGWPVSTGVSTLSTTFIRNGCQLVGDINHMDGSVIRYKTKPATNQAIQIQITPAAWLLLADAWTVFMIDDSCKIIGQGKRNDQIVLPKQTRYLILQSFPALDVRWTISCPSCSPSNLDY